MSTAPSASPAGGGAILRSAEAAEALRNVQAISSEFHGFDVGECELLSRAMTVITFVQGDQILRKGEAASWVGILLQGELEAQIGPRLTFTLSAGEFIGDMSLFEPFSGRAADVHAASDGVIGLFTFDGLDEFMSWTPLLGLKMMRAIGYSTVTKLLHERGRVLRASPTLTALNSEQEKQESLMALDQLTSSAPLFSIFELSELELLNAASQVVKFKSGSTLLHRGQSMPFVAILLQGTVDAMADSSMPADSLSPGAILCPTSLFLGLDAIQPTLVLAKSDGMLLTFTYDETLAALAEKSPALVAKLCKLCAHVGMNGLRGSAKHWSEWATKVKEVGKRKQKDEVFLKGRTLREQMRASKAAPESTSSENIKSTPEEQLEQAKRSANNYKLLLESEKKRYTQLLSDHQVMQERHKQEKQADDELLNKVKQLEAQLQKERADKSKRSGGSQDESTQGGKKAAAQKLDEELAKEQEHAQELKALLEKTKIELRTKEVLMAELSAQVKIERHAKLEARRELDLQQVDSEKRFSMHVNQADARVTRLKQQLDASREAATAEAKKTDEKLRAYHEQLTAALDESRGLRAEVQRLKSFEHAHQLHLSRSGSMEEELHGLQRDVRRLHVAGKALACVYMRQLKLQRRELARGEAERAELRQEVEELAGEKKMAEGMLRSARQLADKERERLLAQVKQEVERSEHHIAMLRESQDAQRVAEEAAESAEREREALGSRLAEREKEARRLGAAVTERDAMLQAERESYQTVLATVTMLKERLVELESTFGALALPGGASGGREVLKFILSLQADKLNGDSKLEPLAALQSELRNLSKRQPRNPLAPLINPRSASEFSDVSSQPSEILARTPASTHERQMESTSSLLRPHGEDALPALSTASPHAFSPVVTSNRWATAEFPLGQVNHSASAPHLSPHKLPRTAEPSDLAFFLTSKWEQSERLRQSATSFAPRRLHHAKKRWEPLSSRSEMPWPDHLKSGKGNRSLLNSTF